jgi:hypothetical protein
MRDMARKKGDKLAEKIDGQMLKNGHEEGLAAPFVRLWTTNHCQPTARLSRPSSSSRRSFV